jgi:hypothetical protein
MDEILRMLNLFCNLTLPDNQLGMPDYLRSKLSILQSVVEQLQTIIKYTQDNLREWEDI